MSVKEDMDKISEKDNRGAASPASRDAAIGRALAGRLPAGEGTCPPAEEIALLLDGALNEAERDLLLGHLASCGRCREVFATARELTGEEVVGSSRRSWYVVSSLAATAVLAVLALRLSPGVRQTAPEMARKEGVAAPRVAEAPSEHSRVAALAPQEGKEKSSAKGVDAAKRSNEPLDLLTPAEAALPAAKAYGFAGRERYDGPAIAVESPPQEGAETAGTSLKIRFTPRQGERVDLASVKVECLKETPIDLTPRLKPYVTASGVSVEKVRMPEGLYRFRVSVADYQGRLSEKEFTVNVSGTF